MKRLGLLLAAGLFLVAHSARAELAVDKGKVFMGPEGIKLEVVPVKQPGKPQKVLIRFSGVAAPFEGKVLMHEVSEYDGKADITTRYKGKGWNSLVARSGWMAAKGYTLYFPGSPTGYKGVSVAYDDAATKALNSEDVARNYELLQKAGELAAIAEFSRKDHEAESDKSYADAVKYMNEQCATAIPARIEWKTVGDDLILKDNLSISGYCEAVLDGVRGVCRDDIGKKAVKDSIKSISCGFGKAADVGWDKKTGALNYTTAKDASNQSDFVKKTLEKKL